jgi:hypothetical protein
MSAAPGVVLTELYVVEVPPATELVGPTAPSRDHGESRKKHKPRPPSPCALVVATAQTHPLNMFILPASTEP